MGHKNMFLVFFEASYALRSFYSYFQTLHKMLHGIFGMIEFFSIIYIKYLPDFFRQIPGTQYKSSLSRGSEDREHQKNRQQYFFFIMNILTLVYYFVELKLYLFFKGL